MNKIISVLSVVLLSLFFGSSPAIAAHFSCALHIQKAPCWKPFQVNFTLIDSIKQTAIAKFSMKKGQLALKQKIDCTNLESFTLRASYTPAIWENRKGEEYPAKITWQVPMSLASGEESWFTQICFAGDFMGVPIPLTDANKCACHFPKVKKQKTKK